MLNCSRNNSIEVLDIFDGDLCKVFILSLDFVIMSLSLFNESFCNVISGNLCMFSKFLLLRRFLEMLINYNGILFLVKLRR